MKGSEDKAPKDLKSNIALQEEKILEFWKENKIFEKTLEKESPEGEFVFYEGPPTANAKPALHHLEARVFKDIIPRFKTMKGFHVRRKGGWDTHGLPVELQIEKKLGLTSKKDIEKYGVEKFNKECKDSVFEYIGDWEVFTDRIGYWVDKENAYYTFNTDYMESVWNILKTVDDKKLLYKDYKVLPWCPRCGTALSSHELALGYENDKDLSVTAKFKVLGEESTYILAWTTTPWTLPGNVALAVGEDIDYVKVKKEKELLILAKNRISIVEEEYEIIEEIKGKDLVGLKYEPLYPFMKEKFADKDSGAFEKSYQVYSADFVNTEDGTGIVHTAVMYGQDDFVLGTKIGLPKFHLVKDDGHFLEGMQTNTIDLSERFVKDEDVAVDIIKDLAHRGLLFKKEKYEHSYPHCWRCKTPLIYYARDSWYIAVSKLRDELVSENEGINWEPDHIKEGRFGEWLREIKDWAISRERYWGTPLPVWTDKDGKYRVIGSVEELKKHIRTNKNKFIFVRHGEAESNLHNIINCNPKKEVHLTEKGKEQSKEIANKINKIDAMYVSPYMRTKETAQIIAESLNFDAGLIKEDKRLVELDFGDLDGKSFDEYLEFDAKNVFSYDDPMPNGESYQDAKERIGEFLYEIDKNHSGETIVVVTHGMGLEAAASVIQGGDLKKSKEIIDTYSPKPGETLEFDFIPLPHNSSYETDLHKPYIDSVELVDEKENELKRVKEVMDVWLDSGAMPFAQDHYPWGKNSYPADFISEAIDQTRGWFYTLHAIGVLMGKGKAYKNVICLGHILDKEGKKMSKSIGNILDPWVLMNKYGVDALRLWMFGVNQPGDSKNFDEKTVDEIVKKVFNPLENILALYDLYKENEVKESDTSSNILDKWILSRLSELISSGEKNLNNFKVFEPSRALRDFVSDFSTWYVRRSRERFKSDDKAEKALALSTTKYVLVNLSKYMAPFTPFFAESLYQRLKSDGSPESVHLCSWPKAGDVSEELFAQMEDVRGVVTKALELRQKAGHKVRQPLAKLSIPQEFSKELLDIIADEVNVKEVLTEGGEIKIDTNLTEDLKEEGIARDIIRAIQDARKTEKLSPSDSIKIVMCSDVQEVIYKHVDMIKSPTQVTDISYSKEKQTYVVEGVGETSFSIVK